MAAPSASDDDLDAYGMGDFSMEFLDAIDRAEEAFPSSFCAPPPSSALTVHDIKSEESEDDFDSMFLEPCSQAEIDAWDEMEQPGYVPSQRHPSTLHVKSEPTSPTRCPLRVHLGCVKSEACIPVPSSRTTTATCVKSEPTQSVLSDTSTLVRTSSPRVCKSESSPPRAEQKLGVLHSDSDSDTDSDDEVEIVAVGPATRNLPSRKPTVSDSDDEIEVISVRFNYPTITTPHGSKIRRDSPRPAPVPMSGTKRKRRDSDSDVFKKPATPPPPSKKPKSPPPSNPHLSQFFAAYPKFDYDPSGPASQQFNQLRQVYNWRRGNEDGDDAYRGFSRAVVQSFIDYHGYDVNDLENWQNLCLVVGIDPIPDGLWECRQAIEAAHVNLMDLVDTHNTGEPVHQFPSEAALASYTRMEEKYFPRAYVPDRSLVKYLLRHIR